MNPDDDRMSLALRLDCWTSCLAFGRGFLFLDEPFEIVDHLIECDQGEAERHELNDGPQAHHRRADPEPSESVFADWSIDDAFWTKPL